MTTKWTKTKFRKAWGKAEARFDQDRAKVCRDSGWTQQEIADEVGLGQPIIARLLKFGAFLRFMPRGIKCEIPSGFTEYEFRRYWDNTNKSHKEDARFQAIYKALAKGQKPRKQCMVERSGPKIKEACADGKPRTTDEIIEKTGLTPKQTKMCLYHMEKNAANGVLCRSEPWKGDRRWTIRELDNRTTKVKKLPTELSDAQGRILEALDELELLEPLLNVHPARYSPTGALEKYRAIKGILQGVRKHTERCSK